MRGCIEWSAHPEGMRSGERAVSRVLFTDTRSMCDHSSGLPVAGQLERPTRALTRLSPRTERTTPSPLFGLSPGGVYPAKDVTAPAVSSYLTISPLPMIRRASAVYFLWHFPWDCSRWTLPTTLSCGARTFLDMALPWRDRYARSPPFMVANRVVYWKAIDKNCTMSARITIPPPTLRK